MKKKHPYQRGYKQNTKVHVLELNHTKIAVPKSNTALKALAIAALVVHETKDTEETRVVVESLPKLTEALLFEN